MRISRVYTDQSLTLGSEVLLDQAASRHLLTVLRLRPDSLIDLFNGQGGEYRGKLLAPEGKQAKVAIESFTDTDRESPLNIHLGVGVSRGDRFDWIVQKSTELGVSAITPLLTERTEVKLSRERGEKKLKHWHNIMISACEQCTRNRLPMLNQPLPLAQWLEKPADLKLVTHHRSAKTLAQLEPLQPASINLLVGPEGGLSETEIEIALQQGFLPLTVGPRVLRTETAPLAAISLLQATWGDMG